MGGSSNPGSIGEKVNGIQISTSCYDQVVPLVYGVTRLAGKHIWMPNDPGLWVKHAGSSGGKGGSTGSSDTYSQAAMMALCEGPIAGIGRVWRDKDVFDTLADAEKQSPLTLQTGTRPQAPWDFLTTIHVSNAKKTVTIPSVAPYTVDMATKDPQFGSVVSVHTAGGNRTYSGYAFKKVASAPATKQYSVSGTVLTFNSAQKGDKIAVTYRKNADYSVYAVGYSGTATVQSSSFDLGSSNAMKNYSFEVEGFYSASGDANPADVIYDFLTNSVYGCGWNAAQVDVELGQDGTAASGYRRFCDQIGFKISIAMDEQRPALEWIADILEATYSEMVWNGSKLKIVPLMDVNVGTYTAVTAIRAALTADDLKARDATEDLITVRRKSVADTFNRVPVEFLDADTVDPASAFNVSVVDVPLESDIIQTKSERKDSARTLHMITSRAHAQRLSLLLARRSCYVTAEYEFKLGWEHAALEPLDLVTLTDAEFGLSNTPVRIRTIEEDEDGYLTVVAETGLLDASNFTPLHNPPTQDGTGGGQDTQTDPLETDPPIIFAPGPMHVSIPELWVGAFGGPAWGGAQVWISWDAGLSYSYAGEVRRGVAGTLTTALAAGAPLDTTNSFQVDVRASEGTLASLQTDAERDAFMNAAWVGGEIISFKTATLQGDGSYLLSNMRRGGYGTLIGTHGVDDQFMMLKDTTLRIPISGTRYGQTVRVKLVSFNVTKTRFLDPSEVEYYDYTLPGIGQFVPILTPPVTVSFDRFNVDDWFQVDIPQSTRVAPVPGAGLRGGVALEATGVAWFISKAMIPFDPAKTYQVTLRMKQTSEPTVGGKNVYVGLAGVGADGSTWVNSSGANDAHSQHYVIGAPTDANWFELNGYWKGTAATGTTGGTLTSPGKLQTNVRYVRPLFIVNYSAGNGVAQVDSLSVQEVHDAAVEAETHAQQALVLAGSKTKVFYRTTAPTNPTDGINVDDIWFDTSTFVDSDGQTKIKYDAYRWDGSTWVTSDVTRLIVAAQIAAGAITADKIAANAITAGKIHADALSTSDYTENANNIPLTGAKMVANAASVSAWAAYTAYSVGDVRSSNGNYYRCRTAGMSAGSGWGNWSSATTYAAGAVVSYSSGEGLNTYRSRAGSNLNHAPTRTDEVWWEWVGPNAGPIEGRSLVKDGTVVWDAFAQFRVGPSGIQVGSRLLNDSWFSKVEVTTLKGFGYDGTWGYQNFFPSGKVLEMSPWDGTNLRQTIKLKGGHNQGIYGAAMVGAMQCQPTSGGLYFLKHNSQYSQIFDEYTSFVLEIYSTGNVKSNWNGGIGSVMFDITFAQYATSGSLFG